MTSSNGTRSKASDIILKLSNTLQGTRQNLNSLLTFKSTFVCLASIHRVYKLRSKLLGVIISCFFSHKNYTHPCFCLFTTETFLHRIDKHPLVVQYYTNFIYHAPLPVHCSLLRDSLTTSLYMSNHHTLVFNQASTFYLQESTVQNYTPVVNSLANIAHFSAT